MEIFYSNCGLNWGFQKSLHLKSKASSMYSWCHLSYSNLIWNRVSLSKSLLDCHLAVVTVAILVIHGSGMPDYGHLGFLLREPWCSTTIFSFLETNRKPATLISWTMVVVRRISLYILKSSLLAMIKSGEHICQRSRRSLESI